MTKRIFLLIAGLGTLVGCATNLARDESALPLYARVPFRDSTVIDERVAFGNVFCSALFRARPADVCSDYLHFNEPSRADVALSAEEIAATVVFVPGLLGECLAKVTTAFATARAELDRRGHETHFIDVSGRSSSAYNAAQIASYLRAQSLTSEELVIVIGYSKGVTDTLEALAVYPDAFELVDAIVSVAGAVAGSPIADDLGRVARRIVARGPLGRGCAEGEGDAIESIAYRHRMQWLIDHPLPETVLYYSLAAFTDRANTSRLLRSSYRRLSRIDARNDGQLIYYDAVIPSSVLLGFANADHWAVALPIPKSARFVRFLANRNDFPRTELMLAIVEYVGGSVRSHQTLH
jgi:hypothetical protein